MFCAPGLCGIIYFMNIKKILFYVLAVFLLAIPILAPAQVNITTTNQLYEVLNRIAGIIARVFWIAAAAFVFYAAFLYLTASGNAEKVSKAHRQLWYTVIAIIVALFAYGLPKFLENTLKP